MNVVEPEFHVLYFRIRIVQWCSSNKTEPQGLKHLQHIDAQDYFIVNVRAPFQSRGLPLKTKLNITTIINFPASRNSSFSFELM